MALFAWQSVVVHGRSGGNYDGVTRFASKRLVAALFGWMHDFWSSPWDERLGYVLWAAVGGLLLRSIRGRKLGPLDMVAIVVASVAAGLYFLMPTQVGYAFLLDLRMAPMVGMTIGLLVHCQDERWSRPLYGVIAAAGLLSNVHCAWQMNRFEREEAAHFDLLLRNLPRGKRLLMLTFRNGSHIANVAPFVHFGSYYRARYGGIASFSFTELPHWPLQYQPALAPPRKQTTFWDWNP